MTKRENSYLNFSQEKKYSSHEKIDRNEEEFNVFSNSSNDFTKGSQKERYTIKKTIFGKGFYVQKSN